MSDGAQSSLELGDFERAVFDLLKAHRARHPEADAPELALRLATMAAAVLVSGVDPLRVPFALERVQAFMEAQVDSIVLEEADPLPGLFDAGNVVRLPDLPRPSPFRAFGAPSLSPPSAGRGEEGGSDAA